MKMEAPIKSLRFLGPPSGEGLLILEDELTIALIAEGNTAKAFLRKIRYPGEERVRVALIIDGQEKAIQMAQTIARACQSIVEIDIMFFESMPVTLIDEVIGDGPPFYIARHSLP